MHVKLKVFVPFKESVNTLVSSFFSVKIWEKFCDNFPDFLAPGNPPGYGSEHLAHVGHLFVDVDMGGLVRSLGHRPHMDGSSGLEGMDPQKRSEAFERKTQDFSLFFNSFL